MGVTVRLAGLGRLCRPCGDLDLLIRTFTWLLVAFNRLDHRLSRVGSSTVRAKGDVADSFVGPGGVGDDLGVKVEQIVVGQLVKGLGIIAFVELASELTETRKQNEQLLDQPKTRVQMLTLKF